MNKLFSYNLELSSNCQHSKSCLGCYIPFERLDVLVIPSVHLSVNWSTCFYTPGMPEWNSEASNFGLSVCGKNFILGLNFWTIREKYFIFGMRTQLEWWPCVLTVIYILKQVFWTCCRQDISVLQTHLFFWAVRNQLHKIQMHARCWLTSCVYWVLSLIIIYMC